MERKYKKNLNGCGDNVYINPETVVWQPEKDRADEIVSPMRTMNAEITFWILRDVLLFPVFSLRDVLLLHWFFLLR